MANVYLKVADILVDIETELRMLKLWEESVPAPEALASTEPFCVDTLSFPQWLQFIFLTRMHMMITDQMPLPNNCGIGPMAEEYFRANGQDSAVLIGYIQRMDEVLSDHASKP